ncbi:hypothetical protein [uncultured Caulobacter sp.]|uniref:hypothetical protein n=1 Tax=uncultured Caulobacter sp. TaxID=158749 RepID=UPI002608CA5C|nr:hypothetical protein [uncultured Caulobacter sp.]
MTMPLKQVSQLAEYGLAIWLAVLAAVVVYRGLVSGRLRELVAAPHDGGVSPTRVQALGVTVAFAGYYTTLGLQALARGDTSLPAISPETLSIFAASLGVHVGGKVYEHRPRPKPKAKRKPRGKS